MSFSQSSEDIRMEGPVLHARCRDEEGNWHHSSLNLNDFLGNNDGRLDPEGSNFFETCSGCGMNGSSIIAVLRQVDGSYDEVVMDLDQLIGNDNGRLVRA
ncbi:Cyanovirin-N [Roridomyces roridus]|uniref:Cyanovirin-N n=1 Tax=Roridomyces roridus TaxID=1738132 RepID=A0AAD7BC09_9AGAR|nr:Cyanovirin-N [Roridomyces roridus]